MFQVNKKTPERRHWHRSSVSIANFEHVIAEWDSSRGFYCRVKTLFKAFKC